MAAKQNPVSVRLSTEGREILKKFSKKLGVTASAVIELALRVFAKEQAK